MQQQQAGTTQQPQQQQQQSNKNYWEKEPGGYVYYDSRDHDIHWRGSRDDANETFIPPTTETTYRSSRGGRNEKIYNFFRQRINELFRENTPAGLKIPQEHFTSVPLGTAAQQQQQPERPLFVRSFSFDPRDRTSLHADIFEDDHMFYVDVVLFPMSHAQIEGRLATKPIPMDGVDMDIIADDALKTITIDITSLYTSHTPASCTLHIPLNSVVNEIDARIDHGLLVITVPKLPEGNNRVTNLKRVVYIRDGKFVHKEQFVEANKV